MANNYFQFKQFTVRHDFCAMKVGTDGVLLGAWADCSNCKNILDIGSGSGLIALMLGQRSPDAFIDAIDIDENACKQTEINVAASPFVDRIRVIQSDYKDFNPPYTYDLIVCNPPFFSQSLKCPDQSRTTARHNDQLSFEDLICKSKSLLNKGGKFAVIIPFDNPEVFIQIATNEDLYICRQTYIKPKLTSPPKRILLEFSKENNTQKIEDELVIEYERHQYSPEYIALTGEFYLKM